MGKHGPNVTQLIVRFISREAVPPGGGLAAGISFFQDSELRKQVIERAEANAMAAIQLIKTAPDNPYGDDDEEIAGMLLKKIEEKTSGRLNDPDH